MIVAMVHQLVHVDSIYTCQYAHIVQSFVQCITVFDQCAAKQLAYSCDAGTVAFIIHEILRVFSKGGPLIFRSVCCLFPIVYICVYIHPHRIVIYTKKK